MIEKVSRVVGYYVVPVPKTAEPSSGTGIFVQLREKKYFVSALHCFFDDFGGKDQVIRSWEETRFWSRDERPLRRTESLHEAVQPVAPDIGFSLPIAASDLLIDRANDLIAVKVHPDLKALAYVEFFDLESAVFTQELTAGLSLFMLGAPQASQVNVPGFGPTLIPQVEHVRFDPDIDISSLSYADRAPSYIYMPYSLTQDGIHPRGFSGAPIFVNKEAAGVWAVSPHLVGIAQRFKNEILIVRKISAVIDLLERNNNAL